MASMVDRVKNIVLYFDHDNHIGGLPHEDIVINPIVDLPKVFNPTKVQHMGRVDEELPEFYNNLERQEEPIDTAATTDDSEEDLDFVDTDNKVDDGDDDLFVDNVDEEVLEDNRRNKKATGSRLGKAAATAWHSATGDDDSESEDLELHEASDGEQGGVRLKFKSFTPDDLNNPTLKIDMSFPSIEMVRKAVTEYSLKHRVDVKMPKCPLCRGLSMAGVCFKRCKSKDHSCQEVCWPAQLQEGVGAEEMHCKMAG
ncbi:uncharacterized protein [Miscanthus floridulus]|uniref:uncharacterized protein isoform X2 n=1 Tax=Miscanthus floridulus TaxID=154761 RepID=UPI00345A8B34